MVKKLLTLIFVALVASMFFATVSSAQQYKFKKQDKDKATKECQDASPCKPELVPTKDDKGNVNLALLEDAKPNADSLLGGWCPARHCTEYLNDGFYNNCRSWISGKGAAVETWAEIDLGGMFQKYVYNLNLEKQASSC